MDFFSCSFLTSGCLLLYIFHSRQCPFMNHHVCDAPEANCWLLRTQSSTELRLHLPESRKGFLLNPVSDPKTREILRPWWTCQEQLSNTGRSWASCLSSFYFPPNVLKIIGSVLDRAQTKGKVYFFLYPQFICFPIQGHNQEAQYGKDELHVVLEITDLSYCIRQLILNLIFL